MRWRRVEVEVVLLDVLAVIAFVAAQTEEPLFENRIAPVPQRQREADQLMMVRESREAVFVPAVDPRPRVIVREVVPRCAIAAVIRAHRAPGALAEIRAPALPGHVLVTRVFEPLLLGGHTFNNTRRGRGFRGSEVRAVMASAREPPNAWNP